MAAYEFSGRVAWSDTDASGRTHFTAAMKWIENGEHALYRARLPDLEIGRLPRRAVAATYHRPFACGDEYTARLSVEHMGSSSIRYVWQLLHGQALAVEGSHAVVHVGPDGRSTPLPAALRSVLEPLLLTGD